ncbi:hypothetical protein [Butyrivibrio sp. LC3010]|uniref:hypothetical protein n=1 Tax=Butyrivibrio sp. LC3010 TaxID=1280680 RepID=UPI0003F5541D|nr:hypothetical protein [Butyrivibrio sp. LC3010]
MISKKIISGLVNLTLVLSLVSGMFIQTPVKVNAATQYKWVLKSSKTEYGNSEYLGDVWNFKHEEKDGQIIYNITRTFSNIDGTFTGIYTTKSDIPPATINGGQIVSLNVSAAVQGGMDNLLCSNNVYLYTRYIDSDGTMGYGRKFTKKSTEKTEGSSVSVWTGPTTNRQYSDSDVVYYKFPEGENEGERLCIELEITTGTMSNGKHNGGLTTRWFYTWEEDKEAIKKAAITSANTAAEEAKKDPTVDKIKAAKDAITAAEKAGASDNELSTAKEALKAAEETAKKAEEEKKKKAEEEKRKKAEEEKKKKDEEERKAAEEAAKSDGSTSGTPAPVGNELKDANGTTTGFVVTNATAGAGEVEFKGTDADRAVTGTFTIPEVVQDRSGNTYKVTGIAPEALKGAAGKTLNIGKDIKKIGKDAFKDSAFTKISIQTDKKGKVTIGKGAFKTKKKATIKVKGAKGSYKTKLIKKIKKQAHKKSKVK